MKLQKLSLADLVALKKELGEYIAFYKKEMYIKIPEELETKMNAVEIELNRRINEIAF
jgi:hypothetical protein